MAQLTATDLAMNPGLKAADYAPSPATTCPSAGSEDDECEIKEVCLWYRFKPGNVVEACPLTQQVRMVLELKRAKYNLNPVLEEPDWLERGMLPCIAGEKGEDAKTDLDDMLAYLDDSYKPYGELRQLSAEQRCAWNEDATERFYETMVKFIRNTKAERDEDLKEAFVMQLDLFNQYLKDRDAPFLAGQQPGLEDCCMAPRLHILQVACSKLKDFTPDQPELVAYMERLFALPAFTETSYEEEEVLKPWVAARRRMTRRLSFDALVRG